MKVADVMSANKVIGGAVQNPKGESFGEIKNLMIAMETGRAAYVILSFGGFLGMGEKLFPIPWAALTFKADKQVYVFDKTKEELENAESFNTNESEWPNMSDKRWGKKVHTHYGVPTYWEVRAG